MSTRTKAFCSECGVENLVTAKFCNGCGAVMTTMPAAAAASPAPAAAVTPTAAAPAADPARPNVVREAYPGRLLQRISYSVLQLGMSATVILAFLSLMGSTPLNWGERQAGVSLSTGTGPMFGRSDAMRSGAAPAYLVGAVAVILVAAACIRFVRPKSRDLPRAALRRYYRTLRERDGIRVLFATGGFRLGLVLIAAIGVGLSVVAVINLATMGDDGFDPTLGVYLAIVLPLVSLIGAIGLWPFGSDVVYMDRQGTVTTG